MNKCTLPDSPEKTMLIKYLRDEVGNLNKRISSWAGVSGLETKRAQLMGMREAYEEVLGMIR